MMKVSFDCATATIFDVFMDEIRDDLKDWTPVKRNNINVYSYTRCIPLLKKAIMHNFIPRDEVSLELGCLAWAGTTDLVIFRDDVVIDLTEPRKKFKTVNEESPETMQTFNRS